MIRATWAAVWWWWLVFHPPAPIERPPLWDGRVYTGTKTHVGVRYHSDAVGDSAITVQITATWLSL